MNIPADSEYMRIIEAVLFAAAEPLNMASLVDKIPSTVPLEPIIQAVQDKYANGGFQLVKIGDKYAFRTAPDLADMLQSFVVRKRRLSQAALETLAIIAYHQPCTRAEIEEIRGVQLSRGTLDVLLASEWVRLRGRRRVPGRPLTYATSDAFLAHFGLERLDDLPGLAELRMAGLLDGRLPPDFDVPVPRDIARIDEDPLANDDRRTEFLDEEE